MKFFKPLSTAALKKQGMKILKPLSPAALAVRRHRERRDLRETKQEREKRLKADSDRKGAEREQESLREIEQEREERLKADSDRKRAERQRKKAIELEDIRRALSFDSGELPDPASHSATMKEKIATAMKQAKQVLHRTQDENNPSRHRAHVCIICDCFILGTDSIKHLKEKDIKQHKHRIGVASYEKYYKTKLHRDLVKQYRVPRMPGLLLSPRSRKTDRGYETCSTCYTGMQRWCIRRDRPPRDSIANGFVIGSIPPEAINFEEENGEIRRIRPLNVEEDVNDVLRAYLAPIRPYGYIFAYSGGSHKAIQGHVQYFEMDQSNVGGVMKYLDPEGVGKTIFAMICGRMTPEQKKIVRKRTTINTKVYMDLLSWFIQDSGHPGFKDLPLPEDIQSPKLIEDKDSTNNTDTSVNQQLEKSYTGETYFFSSAQDPCRRTSVYDSPGNFALAIMNRSAPTLLAVGGQFAKSNEINVEDVLPLAFPYGIGGPNMNRR